MLSFYHNAYTFKQWLKQKYFTPGHPEYVIYTFWFHANTLGAAMLANSENVRIVTRAHGYDIFDERVIYRSHYMRELTLSKINAVYACSSDGATYIRQHYPQYADKIKVSFLGSTKLYKGTSYANDNIQKLTFFSCSRIHSVKRVPQVAQFLQHLAYRFPRIEFEWIHAGDGEERDKVVEIINHRRSANFTARLLGILSNEEVQKLYLKEPVDWFISLSSSEGLPISICEALSYGVPVVATDVGGVHEVVSEDVGIQLSEPTEMETFIIKISEFITDRSAYLKLRRNAEARWQELFDARRLRDNFVEEIS